LAEALNGANFSGSVLKDVEFDRADMVRVNLQSAQLQNAFLEGINLREATLGSNKGIVTLTGPIAGEVKAADLSGADLSDADLREAQLIDVDMSPIQWQVPDPAYRKEQRTDLTRADLRGAHLNGAHLNHAILHEADLRCADLRGTDFTGAEGISKEQIWQQAEYLDGDTKAPDGTTFHIQQATQLHPCPEQPSMNLEGLEGG
jgi:uncharacterized protein YjbI with pentapeptide repeats